MRVVLDTNVWLDWLVFDDPSVAALKSAHATGQIHIDPACLDELRNVLAYPQFQLDPKTQVALGSTAEAIANARYERSANIARLPRCPDLDDQKFLELARDSQADWLITKDKALLEIRRGQLKGTTFRIATPVQWADTDSQLGL